MQTVIEKLELYQSAGRYNELLAATIDSPEYVPDLAAIPWIVGALAFLGRTAEAEGLYESHLSSLSGLNLIATRFFYALAVCRERRISTARELFLQNLKDGEIWIAAIADKDSPSVPNDTKESAKFYMYQGLAFFRYSTGYFRQANFWVRKSLKAATAANYPYAGALAHELSGHVQLQLGRISSGLRSLEISAAKAAKLGHGALEHSFIAAKRLYAATYGLSDADQIIMELNDAIFKCRFEDSYTKASLYVQLAKVMTLKGDLSEASSLLDKASPLVYQVDNPYLETVYNLVLATVQMQRGNYSVALTIARNAAQRASERTHIPSVIRSLGLQAIILDKLSMHRERSTVMTTLRGLTAKTGGYVAQRIIARQGFSSEQFRRGEDPLGDLIDDIHQNQANAIDDIFRTGWTGLLRNALSIDPEHHLVVFDLQPGSLTVFANGDVEHKKEGCSHLIKKLLCSLTNAGDVAKEDLTAKLWSQTYSPLRHDALIYGLIARTRKLLSPFNGWIEVSEIGYRLNDTVKVKNGQFAFRQIATKGTTGAVETPSDEYEDRYTEVKLPDFSPTEGIDPKLAAIMTHLNIRQIEVIKWIEGGETIQPKDLVSRLEVSDATATRDLSKLVELGVIQRFGSGRATFYRSNSNSSENL